MAALLALRAPAFNKINLLPASSRAPWRPAVTADRPGSAGPITRAGALLRRGFPRELQRECAGGKACVTPHGSHKHEPRYRLARRATVGLSVPLGQAFKRRVGARFPARASPTKGCASTTEPPSSVGSL
ncbi:hypothetical protein SKAU_G00317220 [Synaphobranchus kaupii]|uniref:Uncharacterized protein n=1 Tax=Synaphobranchus kaupii TaxID=118154 RepID=A0A9Q1EST4_SYNKA|nr:hypothetical protein SKAU_G00317220 [Synaphobranchus kaupii]